MNVNTTNQSVLKIGENRGAARLWIQGSILTRNGWTPGKRWRLEQRGDSLAFIADDEGNRRVCGNEKRPVIDSKAPQVAELFPIGCRVVVQVSKKAIEVRQVEEC